MKRVTIQDIADALGISRNTVSKALNNANGIADDTREKILKKAIEMEYKPFAYLSALSEGVPASAVPKADSRNFREISLFTTKIFHMTNHFAALMLERFRQELTQFNYFLNIHIVDSENLARRTLPATFSQERCSGILCIEMFDLEYDKMLCQLGLPTLFVDTPNKITGNSLPSDQLYMENTVGITRLVNEMLRKGKRRIGFLGDYEHCQSFYERYTAYRFAMLMAGADVDERFIIRANTLEKLEEPLSALPELPDMFICSNDFVAVDAVQILRKLGKSIPEDVMLSGFDDAPESRIITPALTTVHIHTDIMAFTAVHLLMTRIKEPTLDYRVVHTDTELIFRDSTRC